MAGHKYKSMFKRHETKPHQIWQVVRLPARPEKAQAALYEDLQDDKETGHLFIYFYINNITAEL